MTGNKKLIVIPIAILGLAVLACQLNVDVPFQTVQGSGNVTTEERQLGDFTRIDLSGLGDLEIEFGDQTALLIEAEDNLLPLIETEVNGDTLRIGFKEDTMPRPTEPVRYFLTVVSLEGIETSGLGAIEAPAIQATAFSVNISGGGNTDIASLEADRLEVDISGLGGLNVGGGEVAELNVDISGSGGMESEDLEAQSANVNVSGLGSATIRVSENLDVDISGSGSVQYYGNPSVQEQVSGLGRVEKLGD
jgi:hypothetical protein